MPGTGKGSLRWPGDHPAPTWDPRPRGILNRGGRGSLPKWRSRIGRPTPPWTLLTPLCLLSPETFPFPVGLAALLTWPVLDLVDVAAVRRREDGGGRTNYSPALDTDCSPLCVLGSSLPGAKSRTQQPSPWCQLPASVFPAAPGSGSYTCPKARGAAWQGSGASSEGPRAPPLEEELRPPSACPWKKLCRSLSKSIYLSPPACLSSSGDQRKGGGAQGLAQTPRGLALCD